MRLEKDIKIANELIISNSGNKKGNLVSNRGLKQIYKDLNPLSVEYLTNQISNPRVSRVLEIGCGQAIALNELAKIHPQIKFYGVDIALNQFKFKKRSNVTLKKQDIHNLNFQDNSFDVIFSFFVFPYVVDKMRGLREVYRVLKDEGQALIHAPARYFYPNGKVLIPQDKKNSDVFFGELYEEMILIDKKGKGASCLNESYQRSYQIPWDTSFCNPILSSYKPLPIKEQTKIKALGT